MPQNAAYITFTGIEAPEGGSYTRAHGRTPGIATIRCRTQSSVPPKVGELKIVGNDGNELTFRDCTIDYSSLSIGDSGQQVSVTIRDRRWKWEFPVINGRYNVYRENGDLDTTTQKTPQELARLCLEAMGESNAIVDDMPNDARPEVDWDVDNAAEALESLCEYLGCRIVLQVDDVVAIRRAGQGADLPETDDICDGGSVLNPPEAPSKIAVVGPPDVYQWDFELEAVGDGASNEVMPIDDLPYKPTGGWEASDPQGGFASIADEKYRAKAVASVFRKYRIKAGQSVGVLSVGVTNRWQVELLNRQVEEYEDDNGVKYPRPPVVYGIYYNGRDSDTENGNNVADGLKPLDQESEDEYHLSLFVQGGYSIDTESQIVTFFSPVYRHGALAGSVYPINPASLRLRIAFQIRDEKTRGYLRTEYVKDFGDNGTAARYIKMQQLARSIYAELKNDTGFTVANLVDNKDEFDKEAKTIADAAAAEYQIESPVVYTYESIRQIELDGAIQQVAWEVGSGTPKTVAWRNNDARSVLLSYKERRNRQKMQAAAAAVVVLKAAQAKKIKKFQAGP